MKCVLTALHSTVQYSTVQYCTVLYCTVLKTSASSSSSSRSRRKKCFETSSAASSYLTVHVVIVVGSVVVIVVVVAVVAVMLDVRAATVLVVGGVSSVALRVVGVTVLYCTVAPLPSRCQVLSSQHCSDLLLTSVSIDSIVNAALCSVVLCGAVPWCPVCCFCVAEQ